MARVVPAGGPADYEFPEVPLTRLLDDRPRRSPTTTAAGVPRDADHVPRAEGPGRPLRDGNSPGPRAVRKGDRVAIVLRTAPQNGHRVLRGVAPRRDRRREQPALHRDRARAPARRLWRRGRSSALDKVLRDGSPPVRARTAVREVVVASVVEYLPAKERLLLQLPIARRARPRPRSARRCRRARRSTRSCACCTLRRRPPGRRRSTRATTSRCSSTPAARPAFSKGAMLTHYQPPSPTRTRTAWAPDVQRARGHPPRAALFHAYGLTVCMDLTVLIVARWCSSRLRPAAVSRRSTSSSRPVPRVPPNLTRPIVDSGRAYAGTTSSPSRRVSGANEAAVGDAWSSSRRSRGRLVEGYGMTETSPSTHGQPVFGKRKTGTIGHAAAGHRVPGRIAGRCISRSAVGEPGELAIRGPQVFAGYWQARRRDEGRRSPPTASSSPATSAADGRRGVLRDRRTARRSSSSRAGSTLPVRGRNVLILHARHRPTASSSGCRPLSRREVKAYVVSRRASTMDRAGHRRLLRGVPADGVQGPEDRGVPRVAAGVTVVGKVLRRVLLERRRPRRRPTRPRRRRRPSGPRRRPL